MTTGIIPNQRSGWYDTGLQASDSVLISQINYAGVGTEASALKTRTRLMQDMFRHTLPNSVRQGLGLSVSAQQIDISAGDAIIAGRWAWTDTGDSISTAGVEVGTFADYYVVFRVELSGGGKPADASGRDPENEVAVFDIAAVSGYSPDEFEIVLGKVNINDQNPTFTATTDKYTDIPDQLAVGRIVPRSKSADGQNSYSSVRLAYATGAVELIDQISTESYGARIFNKLQLDDTTGSSDASLKNAGGVIMARNAGGTDDDYVPMDADSYKIDGVTVISNSRQLDNVTIINSTLNNVTWAGNLISTASRQIQMNSASDTTLSITNTGAGKANVAVEGAVTAYNASFTQPLPISAGGTQSGWVSGPWTASQARTSLGLTIGTNVQAYDAGLQSIAGLVEASNKMIYQTGVGAYAITNAAQSAYVLVGNASGNPTFVGITGNVEINDAGVTTIQSGVVTNDMLAGSIANTKLSNSTYQVVAGNALTNGGTANLGGSVTLHHYAFTTGGFVFPATINNNTVIQGFTYDNFGHLQPGSWLTRDLSAADVGASTTNHSHAIESSALNLEDWVFLPGQLLSYSDAVYTGFCEGGAAMVNLSYEFVDFAFSDTNDYAFIPLPHIYGKTINVVTIRAKVVSGNNKDIRLRCKSIYDGTAIYSASSFDTVLNTSWQSLASFSDFTPSQPYHGVVLEIKSEDGDNSTVRITTISVFYKD